MINILTSLLLAFKVAGLIEWEWTSIILAIVILFFIKVLISIATRKYYISIAKRDTDKIEEMSQNTDITLSMIYHLLAYKLL